MTTAASSFEVECERLRTILADQIEHDALREARATAVTLLCLNPADPEGVSALAFLDETLAMADTHALTELLCLRDQTSSVNCVAFSPDGSLMLTASGNLAGSDGRLVEDRTARLREAATGKELRRLAGFLGVLTSAAFTPDGRCIFAGSREGSLCLFDVGSGNLVRRFENRSPVNDVAVAADGKRALTAGGDKVARLWDLASGARVSRMAGHDQPITAVLFLPGGIQVATASSDCSIRLWDAANGVVKRRLDGHKLAVLSIACAADGKLLASASADSTIRLWDTDRGQEVGRLQGHVGAVNHLAFSPDGAWVISAGSDQSVRLWEVATGRELQRFDGHTAPVQCVAFSPDGGQALSGGRDATARLWRMPSVAVRHSNVGALASEENLGRLRVTDLIEAIGRSRILEPAQWEEVSRGSPARFANAYALAQFLLERHWLTDYQVDQLVEGNEQELVLGNYVLLQRLGEGGMGQVFRARDVRDQSVVALKFVKSELMADAAAVERFRWEIRSLAKLSHPNIIKILEASQVGNRHFFTMEYIDGTDLGRLVEKFGPLPVPLACAYIRQAALGLEHAHEHCLIHRDIKPANLVLTLSRAVAPGNSTQVGTFAVVKVIDWGLAGLRLPNPEQGSSEPQLREKVVGTADYVAPEQIDNANSADIRADIYSLGCSLYQLLTGKPPFPGGALLQKLLHHQKTAPKPVKDLRPDVPDGLSAVIQKMLAKKPADRYRAPSAVASALKPFIE